MVRRAILLIIEFAPSLEDEDEDDGMLVRKLGQMFRCQPIKWMSTTVHIYLSLPIYRKIYCTHRSKIRILRIFSFIKFNEFYEIFSIEKNSQKNRNFANHRCLTCFDVLECNVHL